MSRVSFSAHARSGRLSALAVALAVALPAPAQDVSSSSRFTPVLGAGEALYPQSPTTTAAPPRAVDARSGAVDYSANRQVDRIVVELDRDGVPADGQTPVRVRVQLLGADGLPLAGPAFATIEHSGGRIRLAGSRTDEFGPGAADADKATPGVQLALDNGVAEFDLIAPHDPQDVLLRITAGGESAQGVVGFLPEMRELLATGLIEGIVNFSRRGNRDLIAPVEHGDAFEREIRRWEKQFNDGKANASARTAFFVKGRIKGEYLLTAAYDSDKEVRSRLLRDVQPEEFYPVYGDSSLHGFDARSSERLYVRIDQGRSYLLYGDFQTGQTLATTTGVGGTGPIPQRSLGTYNRTATGLGWHFENARVSGNVFAIQDSLRQVIEEFASQGSGPYALRNNAVLEGSERVEVVVRDRYQPSRIVEVRRWRGWWTTASSRSPGGSCSTSSCRRSTPPSTRSPCASPTRWTWGRRSSGPTAPTPSSSSPGSWRSVARWWTTAIRSPSSGWAVPTPATASASTPSWRPSSPAPAARSTPTRSTRSPPRAWKASAGWWRAMPGGWSSATRARSWTRGCSPRAPIRPSTTPPRRCTAAAASTARAWPGRSMSASSLTPKRCAARTAIPTAASATRPDWACASARPNA